MDEPTPSVKAKRLADLYPFSTHVSNSAAAQILGLKEQTLRGWRSTQKGKIQPEKVGARIMWPLDGLQRLLDGEAL